MAHWESASLERKLDMKKVGILFIAVISVYLCSCGSEKIDGSVMNLKEDDYDQSVIENQQLADTEIVVENDDTLKTQTVVPTSNKEIAVPYNGDLCIRSIVSTDDIIFLSGLEPNSKNNVIHKMKIEDKTSEKLPIDIPEDMMIQGINVDKEGNLHIFITDSDRSVQRCEMWVSDQKGNVIQKIDIKEVFAEDGPSLQVLCEFAIDGEGRYYISKTRPDSAKRGIIVLDKSGNVLGAVESSNSGLWNLHSLARGRDGKIYVANSIRDDDRIAVMSIDPEGLCIKECYAGVLPSGYGGCVRLRAGINADLFLYGADGIYLYDLGDETGKKLIDENAFPFPREGGLCNEFLADGRFLFVDGEEAIETVMLQGQEYPVNVGISQNIIFYYIPVASGVQNEE